MRGVRGPWIIFAKHERTVWAPAWKFLSPGGVQRGWGWEGETARGSGKADARKTARAEPFAFPGAGSFFRIRKRY